jgi:hypothetical protein
MELARIYVKWMNRKEDSISMILQRRTGRNLCPKYDHI